VSGRRPLLVWFRLVAISIAISVVATACGSDGGSEGTSEEAQLTVLAAASLTEAFGDIADEFEQQHDGVEVSVSFGPSDGLATQIIEGAPSDVFASASGTWMDAVEEDGPGVTSRVDFVRNRLCVITPIDDPAGIESIADLGDPGVKLVLAAKEVPVGGYSREALANAGIATEAEANVVSNEEDVKAVVQKVLLGEADAGIVYITDLTEDVEGEITPIRIPDDVNIIATYPIGVVAAAPEPDLGQEFVDLVTGPVGQEILASYDFMPPA